MQALALFPSELDAREPSHNSIAREMEAAFLTDFPSEASMPAQKEAGADGVVRADLVIASGISNGAMQVPAGRVAAPRQPQETVGSSPQLGSSPRDLEVRGGRHWSLSRIRVPPVKARGIVLTSVTAMLGTFIGIAMVPSKPVFMPPHAALAQPRTITPVSPDTPAVQLPEPPPGIASAPVVSETAVTSDVSLPETQRLVTRSAERDQHTISTESFAMRERLSVVERPSAEPTPGKASESRVASPDRLQFRGALSVDTDVAGAGVYVDGHLAGLTPLMDWQVRAGSHVVRIELDGYQRWSAVIRIVADQTNHLDAKLRPIEPN